MIQTNIELYVGTNTGTNVAFSNMDIQGENDDR